VNCRTIRRENRIAILFRFISVYGKICFITVTVDTIIINSFDCHQFVKDDIIMIKENVFQIKSLLERTHYFRVINLRFRIRYDLM
jgi:hypothetical protein